ncbi:hypothetical protein SISNIDRAFT_162900 [Sistotremastrum niveocremeum HHB9708]|uniref:Uncharacterized protein n=1 Tax=Sistotremastrum niveocremeum HHB9708 TaxID=1314777 RepID=A0A164SNM8_9AGAM|nr:hypothetical protein SISNIDRAFT_162900 [Sistotremastrum niveocremeum HHB9708]
MSDSLGGLRTHCCRRTGQRNVFRPRPVELLQQLSGLSWCIGRVFPEGVLSRIHLTNLVRLFIDPHLPRLGLCLCSCPDTRHVTTSTSIDTSSSPSSISYIPSKAKNASFTENVLKPIWNAAQLERLSNLSNPWSPIFL